MEVIDRVNDSTNFQVPTYLECIMKVVIWRGRGYCRQ